MTQNSLSFDSAGASDDDNNSETMLLCKRDGCNNPPIDDPMWENEYCSSYCLINHCKTVFQKWVQQNQQEVEVIEIIDESPVR